MAAILLTPPAIEPITLAEPKLSLRVEHNDDDTLITTLAGVVIVSGAPAAQQAHVSDARPAIVGATVLVAAAVAFAPWAFWPWRQKRQQEAPISITKI